MPLGTPVLRGIHAGTAAALLALVGCSGGDTVPPLSPVKGSVTVDGKPVTSGAVTFYPVAADPNHRYASPTGQIDSAGTYELFTSGQPGAPAGKYKVTVNPSMVPTQGAKSLPKAPFDEKYRQEKKTPLQVDVPAASYDLKLKS